MQQLRPAYGAGGAIVLYHFTNSFPYLLNRVGVRIAELFSQRVRPYGVTLQMYRVLAALSERPAQRLSDLSGMTTIEVSTLSRLVGTMKRQGLVTKRRLGHNARTVEIDLTAKGRSLTAELIPIASHFEDVAIGNSSPKEIQKIKRFLKESYDSLNVIQAEVSALRRTARASTHPPRQAVRVPGFRERPLD